MQISRTVEFEMPRTLSSQIGHCVYLYLDPDTGAPLYVRKGQGQRILAHLVADGDCEKRRKMRAMRDAGKQPVLCFVRHGLSAAASFDVALGSPAWTNRSTSGAMNSERSRWFTHVRDRTGDLETIPRNRVSFRITNDVR